METKKKSPMTTRLTNLFVMFAVIILLLNTVVIYVNHTGSGWLSTAIETDLLLLVCLFLLMKQVTKSVADSDTSGEGIDAAAGNSSGMQHSLNRDPLTGIRNKTAYDNEIRRLEGALGNGYKEFGLALIDINSLSTINGKYGKEYGDEDIKRLCRLVCETFKHSPVFRLEDHEFGVILENDDYKNTDILTYKFNDQINSIAKSEELKEEERFSAALGLALFEPSTDKSVEDVYKRTKESLAERKKDMKA